MELSPFPHQGPLSAEQVRGRAALVDDLIERVTARRVTALLGPRRFGKTSVLRKVAAVCEEAGTSIVWLDLYETSSTADFAIRVDAALAASRGAVRHRFGELAATAQLNLGMFKVEFSRPPSQRPIADAALHVALDILIDGALSQPTVLIIDEFTGIADVRGAAGMLRTKLQHHVQEIGVLFAGSQPSLMSAMFTEQSMPFYGQADLIRILPFYPVELADIVSHGFDHTGRSAGPLPGLIHAVTHGHPYRSMQLADAAWLRTPTGETCDNEIWMSALSHVQDSNDVINETMYASCSQPEQGVLRAIASSRPLYGATLDLYGVSAGGMAAARNRLTANGIIESENATISIVDPLLAGWIRRRFDV